MVSCRKPCVPLPQPTVVQFIFSSLWFPTPPNTSHASDDDGNSGIVSISVGSTTYRVIQLIFQAQTLIGRATKAFLVELPDGTSGVLKDSWITTNWLTKASFLNGLNIPFGPQLIDHCILRNTGTFWDNPIVMSPIQECREKQCIVTSWYPAGYKWHALTDYVHSIHLFGGTDDFSTQLVGTSYNLVTCLLIILW